MNKIVKFLFFVEREFHFVLLKPLIQYIHNHQLGEIALYCYFQPNNQQISYFNSSLNFPINIVDEPLTYHSDITFMADFSYQFVEGLGFIVNIGHGTISKGWYYTDHSISSRENAADLLCVPGEIHKSELMKKVNIPVRVTGMPKLDKVFDHSLDKINLLTKMNLNINNKTVLLAPTFNDEFSIIPYLSHSLRKYIPDYLNVIIKLHGVTPDHIKSAFRQIIENSENIYLCEDYDISECIVASDVMISDVSSVVYEFLSTYKPVILFDSPKQKEYQNYNENDIEYRFRDIGPRFSNPDKLPELLFRTLTNPQLTEDQIKIADSFVSIKSQSTKLVIDAALEMFNQKKKRKLHLCLIDHNNENTKSLISRFSDRFNISVISDLKDVKDLVNSLSEDLIFIHDTTYEMSPQMPVFLETHLTAFPQIGVVAPLILNNEINYQQAKLRVVLNEEFSTKTMAIQLTYSFAGQNLEIPYCESHSFAIRKQYLTSDNHYTSSDALWKSILTHVSNDQKSIALAFDTMIYHFTSSPFKKTQNIEEKPAETPHNIPINQDEDLLKKRLAEDPFDEDRVIDLIDYYYKNKLWDSIDIYSDMIPQNYKARWYSARSLEEQKHIEKAYDDISHLDINCIDDFTWKAKYLALRAKLLIKMDKAHEAEKIIEKALLIDPHCIDALLARAAFYMMNNQLDFSAADFEKVLSFEEKNRTALVGLGIIKQFSYDFKNAELYFSQVLEQNEEDLDAINGLVKCAWHTKSFTLAENALKAYLDCHPAKLDILFTLSGIYFEQKKFALALEQLEKIFLFDEDFAGAKELYKRIKNQF